MIFYYLSYSIMFGLVAALTVAIKLEQIESNRKKNSIYYHKAMCRRGEIIDVEYEEVA